MIPKIIYVFHSGIAVPYLTSMLDYLHKTRLIELQAVTLRQFSNFTSIPGDIFIIYQTYPDEHHHKFEDYKNMIQLTDDIISNHKNVILFDAHDSGTVDGFSRLPKLPRIKNTPNITKIQEYNIIVPTTFPLKRPTMNYPTSKNIDISFKASLMDGSTHPSRHIRCEIEENLKKYKFGKRCKISLGKDKKTNYMMHLAQTKISVNAPGYGEACIRHLMTLNCGSCMLAHESINNIKLLPGADLVDGDDYLSFTLDNLYEKLDYLLSKTHEIKRITANGRHKFQEGYPIIKPAMQLINYINSRM